MQLVANGPDIPDELLQAHEEGKVVFFCGAGISYPAGLPGFKGLVDQIYEHVGTTCDPTEQNAYDHCQYDATLDLLERRIPGQRLKVRKALAEILKPNRKQGSRDTHKALLQLARSRDESLRLVTTNFDRIFENLIPRIKPKVHVYPAPLLPIPKNSRWNGLVYLHGLLPKGQDDSALNRLVLTSGDFGLAYLTERWAARFVSDLFQNYTVCFVGYSIEDPVLRYMMDALAADRMQGENTPQAFAFASSKPGEQDNTIEEWTVKGVTPITYEVPASRGHDHSALHSTLKKWSEIYRDGILGKERMVMEYAMARPSASTQQDDFVGRMLWALSDESGLPAKQFADYNPAPSIDWLEAFSERRYQCSGLGRFGLSQQADEDDTLRFSLLRRPTPQTLAPWMGLASSDPLESLWDPVMHHLARWLIRHLDDPKLILWLVKIGGQLHDRLAHLIEKELDKFAHLEQTKNMEELERIQTASPMAVPRPLLSPVWRLLLTNRIKSPSDEVYLYHWQNRFDRYGLTTTVRLQLRELLAPKISLREPFSWDQSNMDAESPERLSKYVDWELVLTANNVRHDLESLKSLESWRNAMPEFLEDSQLLLRDALDLKRELGENNDHSNLYLPSIQPHRQNRGFRDWVVLIEIVRDAWQSIHDSDPPRANQIAQSWFTMPYPTFKRLALFAASQDNCIASEQWVDWLVGDDAWCLWSSDTMRETMRLLVLQGRNLTLQARVRLEAAILSGPPEELYGGEIEQDLAGHLVWLRLEKLKLSGHDLDHEATERLITLSTEHPEWKIADNESDEFSNWISVTGDLDYEERITVDNAPRKRKELVNWLKQPPIQSKSPLHQDTWRETCRTRFFHCAFALCNLAKEGDWPSERWRVALQVWSEEGQVSRSWRFVAPCIQTIPEDVLMDIIHSITWWLETVSKSLDCHEKIFLDLCQRILNLQNLQHPTVNDEPITRAINHPVGHITQALINLWFNRTPKDNDELPSDLKPIFTQLCDVRTLQFRHGRVLLSSQLIALFRVDRAWTQYHLFPLLDWTTDATEARAAWSGYLWSARLYRPLFVAFKEQFLDTIDHYDELGEQAKQFVALLTLAALEPPENFTQQELQQAFRELQPNELLISAKILVQALEGASERREEYWNNRIRPFWQYIWPKSIDLATDRVVEGLAQLCVASQSLFPKVLITVSDWLKPLENPHYIVHQLHKAELSEKFPDNVLSFLDVIINDQPWVPSDLEKCLATIGDAKPDLRRDKRYKRLEAYSRKLN